MKFQTPEAGITRPGESLDGIVWNVLGQTYKPVQMSQSCFAFDTLFPAGTFVPVHVHPDQDEFIRVLDGAFDITLDGEALKAKAGDLVRLPMGSRHGIYNNSSTPTRALFWVTPAQRLADLFAKLHLMTDREEVVRVSREHNILFQAEQGAGTP